MFKMATSQEIGEYLSKLASEKYGSQRQFCIKWLETEGASTDEQDIKYKQNKFSQIKKGENNIPVADLECICNLLEISCEELLSAGKYFIPDNTRLTNYTVAFSQDKDIWEEYINNPDKPILNPDEYGKTVIDYAIYYRNVEFINYLIEKEYIVFDSDIKDGVIPYHGYQYGVKTSIKGRNIGDVDYYMPEHLTNYRLRGRLMLLAVEMGSVELLEHMSARILPYLYNMNFTQNYTQIEFDEYRDNAFIDMLGNASNEVVEYMTDEFELYENTENERKTYRFLYPYISDILNSLVEKKHPYTKNALEKAVDYNKKTYEKLGESIKHMIADTYNFSFLPMEELRKKDLQDKIDRYFPDQECKNEQCKIEMFRKTNLTHIARCIINDIMYSQGNEFIKVQSIVGRSFEKYIFNMVHVNAESSDPEIKKMIDELNHYYDKILSIKAEMEENDYAKIMF